MEAKTIWSIILACTIVYAVLWKILAHMMQDTSDSRVAPRPTDYSRVAPRPTDYSRVAPRPTDYSRVAPRPTDYSRVAPRPTDYMTTVLKISGIVMLIDCFVFIVAIIGLVATW
jgi:hypothetical protein